MLGLCWVVAVQRADWHRIGRILRHTPALIWRREQRYIGDQHEFMSGNFACRAVSAQHATEKESMVRKVCARFRAMKLQVYVCASIDIESPQRIRTSDTCRCVRFDQYSLGQQQHMLVCIFHQLRIFFELIILRADFGWATKQTTLTSVHTVEWIGGGEQWSHVEFRAGSEARAYRIARLGFWQEQCQAKPLWSSGANDVEFACGGALWPLSRRCLFQANTVDNV